VPAKAHVELYHVSWLIDRVSEACQNGGNLVC